LPLRLFGEFTWRNFKLDGLYAPEKHLNLDIDYLAVINTLMLKGTLRNGDRVPNRKMAMFRLHA